MDYSFIIAIIPVILVVAFIAWIAKKITDGERIDMKEGILGIVILMVAVLVMVPMISSTQVYTWDEDTGELVIQQNISGGVYAWDTYDDQIRSIVIKPGVTQIGNSAFDGATNLEYLSIPDSVTDIGNNAFGVTFEDPFGNTVSDIAGAEYAGVGNGTLWICDSSIYTYGTSGTVILGLASTGSGAKYLVFPNEHNGNTILTIGYQAFMNNADIEAAIFLPDSKVTTFSNGVFKGCTSLVDVALPKTIETFGVDIFHSCSALVEIEIPEGATALGGSMFHSCTSLETVNLPDSLDYMSNYTFTGCSALSSIEFPERVATIGLSSFTNCGSLSTLFIPKNITAISNDAFRGCTGVTSVSFETGFDATLGTNCFFSWTFYATDGTTTIDKTVAANLAGKTFQGTASALVEVEPGQLALTPQQIQQVHLHDTELQDLKDQISIEPLPLQPSLQEQELTA